MNTRVLLFHPALPPYRVDLFNALAKRFDLRLVFLRENLLSQTFDQGRLRRDLIANHRYVQRKVTLGGRTVALGLGDEIRQFNPDVVITQEFSPTTLTVLAKRGLLTRRFAQVIWTDDNPASVENDAWLRTVSRRVALPRTDGLIVLSDSAAAMYRERYSARCAIGVSPLLQDEEAFRGRLARVNEAVRRLVSTHGLTGKRVLLFVGRLAPEKRVDRLVTAYATARREFADAMFVIVGDGPERPSLEALARSRGVNGSIIFVGRREGSELYAWYRVGGLFALASESETFGAVVNEALLAGMPVLCSTRAGASTLVRNGAVGSVFDAANPEAVVAALREWLGRVPPFQEQQFEQLRPSLMHHTFRDAVDAFASLVEEARMARAANA
jgi:glycosyltransferase involved in cell wall biosynthesis